MLFSRRNDFQKLASGLINNDTTPHNNLTLAKQSNRKTSTKTNTSVQINSPSDMNPPSMMTQSEQRKTLKVRKVKSEVKYVECPAKDSVYHKNKESKSDHEFANETDVSSNSILSKIIYDVLRTYNFESKMQVEVICSKI